MTTLRSLPKAVLFDYDGVLVASETIHLSAWMQLLGELGLPQTTEIIEKNVGRTAPEIMRQILEKYRPEHSPTFSELQEFAVRKNQFYVAQAEFGLQTYPGVPEGLNWLKSQGVQIAIVSNGRRQEILKTLGFLGIQGYFDQIISRDDTPAFKPDPMPYLIAAASFDLDPHECIAVEDSPPGLQAALLAKIPTAAIASNFDPEHLKTPVPGRADLKPTWVYSRIELFFDALKAAASSR